MMISFTSLFRPAKSQDISPEGYENSAIKTGTLHLLFISVTVFLYRFIECKLIAGELG